MKAKIISGILSGGLLVLAAYGVQRWNSYDQAHLRTNAVEQASGWTSEAELLADLLIARYGPPQEVTAWRMQWDGVWPWKNIIVENLPQAPLEQVVTYHVPVDKVDALRGFAHGPLVFPDEDELVARSDSEELNRLSLNLAIDIATGRRSPADADRFFLRTVGLHAAGKSSPYMDRLLFVRPALASTAPSP